MKDFTPYRSQVIGIDQKFATPYGEKRILYADWTASGRLYRPIHILAAGLDDLLNRFTGRRVLDLHRAALPGIHPLSIDP